VVKGLKNLKCRCKGQVTLEMLGKGAHGEVVRLRLVTRWRLKKEVVRKRREILCRSWRWGGSFRFASAVILSPQTEKICLVFYPREGVAPAPPV